MAGYQLPVDSPEIGDGQKVQSDQAWAVGPVMESAAVEAQPLVASAPNAEQNEAIAQVTG